MTASGLAPQVSGRVSQSAFDGSTLRVVLLLDVADGAQQRFLGAYERVCDQVASTPGHIRDQLCQSLDDPSQWLITSEWESAPPFLAWVNSEEHMETVRPLRACLTDTRSLRFRVIRETGGPAAAPVAAVGPQSSPRPGGGVVRHALLHTVRPGSESEVADILAGHTLPAWRAGDTARLHRTSLFVHGNRVVRIVELRELRGDLLAGLLHVTGRPEVRAVEDALTPHLTRSRDLDDPQSARVSLTRAAMPAVHHVAPVGPVPSGTEVRRLALYHPAREGAGGELARLLSRQDELAGDDPLDPVRSATVFHRDDTVVRVVEVAGDPEAAPGPVLGLRDPADATELADLLDGEALGVDGLALDEDGLLRLLAHARMRLVADLVERRS
ncbi:TcmI family type II polyketide cyclase [Streptomyces sp. TRM43335]|uniref:TcmI family type II polyketide cyclase n=1 Tax=Streptomyces taklimakanensis TaxID=2569853 RepID=A0A6G2BJA3_9ACTN|nr:SchA/CurD-like domain-containing protein [Streptomyces taklimakanensis]MTE22294.1 TcmI family type II polyketide cyclase [Streptomyces taklimakanensis]